LSLPSVFLFSGFDLERFVIHVFNIPTSIFGLKAMWYSSGDAAEPDFPNRYLAHLSRQPPASYMADRAKAVDAACQSRNVTGWKLEGSKNRWHFGAVADSVGWGIGNGGAAGVF
jgi:hypothetical protein